MFCTFLNGRKMVKRRLMLLDSCKVYEIQISVSTNKVLLERSHSFTIVCGCSASRSELNGHDRPCGLRKKKCLLSGPLQKKFNISFWKLGLHRQAIFILYAYQIPPDPCHPPFKTSPPSPEQLCGLGKVTYFLCAEGGH